MYGTREELSLVRERFSFIFSLSLSILFLFLFLSRGDGIIEGRHRWVLKYSSRSRCRIFNRPPRFIRSGKNWFFPFGWTFASRITRCREREDDLCRDLDSTRASSSPSTLQGGRGGCVTCREKGIRGKISDFLARRNGCHHSLPPPPRVSSIFAQVLKRTRVERGKGD